MRTISFLTFVLIAAGAQAQFVQKMPDPKKRLPNIFKPDPLSIYKKQMSELEGQLATINALAKGKHIGNNGKGHDIYQLNGGMKYVRPDSSFRSNMPVVWNRKETRKP